MSLNRFGKLAKNFVTASIVSVAGITLANEVAEFKFNPNMLESCPEEDHSKKTDLERVMRWNNCWGKYRFQFSDEKKGVLLEGEWRNGALNGQGIYSNSYGDKYKGGFQNNKHHGKGAHANAAGDYCVGEFKDGKRHGLSRSPDKLG